MRCKSLLLGSFVAVSALTTVACDDGGNTGGAGGATSSTSTTSTKSSSGASMTTTGASMTTTGSSMTTTGSSMSSSSSSSVSTGSGMMSMFSHLVITEVSVSPDGPEFIEIWNPTAQAVDLTNYYVSDNRTYWEVPAGMPWAPPATQDTDFLGGFPQGTMIGPDAVITIAFRTGMMGFEAKYNKCPNFFVTEAAVSCGGNMVPPLRQPVPGTIEDGGNTPVGLSNSREMLVLFTWDGNTANLVKDIDYVVWGDPKTDEGASVDKTGKLTYKADTKCEGEVANPVCNQKTATAPMVNQSIERCGMGEVNETQTGGNGANGSDETSEDLGAAFVVQATPTPGVKNACLP